MKKLYLILAAVCTAFMLTACGMTAEEITTYMTSLEASYQNGEYDQAQSEIETLDKEYDKMTDEQKTKFDELKSSVEYAIGSSAAINDGLSRAQGLLDQKMYFEASQELENLASSYMLPPADQKRFDEKKVVADNGIKEWKITSAIQEVEQLLNSGDYTSAEEKLNDIDISSLSQDQHTKYQSLQTGISDAKTAAAKAAAEAAARAEAQRKANEGISASKAKSIAADALSMSVSSITITDEGSYYSAYGEEFESDGFKNEAACKVDKKTGNVYDRVG